MIPSALWRFRELQVRGNLVLSQELKYFMRRRESPVISACRSVYLQRTLKSCDRSFTSANTLGPLEALRRSTFKVLSEGGREVICRSALVTAPKIFHFASRSSEVTKLERPHAVTQQECKGKPQLKLQV